MGIVFRLYINIMNILPGTEPVSNEDGESVCIVRFLIINGESFQLFSSLSSTVLSLKEKVLHERPRRKLYMRGSANGLLLFRRYFNLVRSKNDLF